MQANRTSQENKVIMNTDTTILITGTSSGFGFLTARTLLEKGFTVVAAMREPDRANAEKASALRSHAETADGTLHLIAMDVSQDDSVSAAVEVALAWFDHIDVLVNNAGVGLGGFCETVTTGQLKRLFEVNLFGVHRVTRALLPVMRAAGKGLIVNVSSIMGRVVIPFSAAYTASKFALEGLSESLRYELAGTGVEVVVIEPGGFPTAFRENMDSGADTGRLQGYGPLIDLPQKMWAGFAERMTGDAGPDPQRVADAVAALIRMPHGTRPFRTVVDPLMNGAGANAVNKTAEAVQTDLLKAMAISELPMVRGKATR
jgi:NAD(P)-dependent dehydrogenase (short-subunit alcohol dehydrogenase family)